MTSDNIDGVSSSGGNVIATCSLNGRHSSLGKLKPKPWKKPASQKMAQTTYKKSLI